MSCDLYRHYDRFGALLYVGISLSAIGRLAQHRSTSGWYDSIARVAVEKFSTAAAASEAEKIAIKTEKPLHNRMHAKNCRTTRVKPEGIKQDDVAHWSIRKWMICYTPDISFIIDAPNKGQAELVAWPDELGHSDDWYFTTGACDLKIHDFDLKGRCAFVLSTAMGLILSGSLKPDVVHKVFWSIHEYRLALPPDTAAPMTDRRFGKYAGDTEANEK